MAVIKPMVRSNICINAHPVGCAKDTLRQIEFVREQKSKKNVSKSIKNVLVLGCSTGYGLASRIVAAFEYGADTIGVSFEKEATEKKAGTPGWYNNKQFDKSAAEAGLRSETFNMDAFSNECRAAVAAKAKEWGVKFDLVVYSLASPVRNDPVLRDAEGKPVMYRSVIKPVGKPYGGNALDMMAGTLHALEAEPAQGDDIANTVKVMGGEDWGLWIDQLSQAGVLADGCKTVAYSYIGPKMCHAIYRDGTIGAAKKDLEAKAKELDAKLKKIGGAAYVSVNKALMTRSSAVIPVITLYLGALFKVQKARGTHEGCIEQMERLFTERLYRADGAVPTDSEGRIRIDDWELDPEVQAEIDKIMPNITEANLAESIDLDGIKRDFLNINGFDVPGVDYEKDVERMDVIE